MKNHKTNAMRVLEQAGIDYETRSYPHGKEAVDGIQVAQALAEDPACVFKTLLTQANTKEYLVFMIPVAQELDLKAAARSAAVKSLELIAVKEITRVSGYVRGGCSPLAMKKAYRTFIDQSALDQPRIYFSGGKIGLQIGCAPQELIRLLQITPARLARDV